MKSDFEIRLARLGRSAKEAAKAYDIARELLDQEIDRAEAMGYSVRTISRAAGVAPATVVRALAREGRKRG